MRIDAKAMFANAEMIATMRNIRMFAIVDVERVDVVLWILV